MACLLRLPAKGEKGIVSFTTQEEIEIRKTPSLLASISSELKKHYLVALHYNWHNFDAKPDDLFDVHFAGKDDLRVTNGKTINLFEFDACNFTKSSFNKSPNEKHWDVLYVARAVFFKGVDEFLETVRQMYDQGQMRRVLFICPMPPPGDAKKYVQYDLWDKYQKMFSPEEQDLFNLLILRERYPFFFDRSSLAHFYKSSKIFVHTAPDERRCRVAGYAWSAGMPVVGKENVAAIVPPDLRKEPGFWLANSTSTFVRQIENALAFTDGKTEFPIKEYQEHCSEIYMIPKLKKMFSDTFGLSIGEDSLWFTQDLDIRLGRHHTAGKDGTNNINQSLLFFIEKLLACANDAKAPQNTPDPEKAWAKGQAPIKTSFLKNFLRGT